MSWRRALVVAAAWSAAISVILVVVRFTRVGPVLVQIPHSHGLHLGDLATALMATTSAVLATYVARPR